MDHSSLQGRASKVSAKYGKARNLNRVSTWRLFSFKFRPHLLESWISPGAVLDGGEEKTVCLARRCYLKPVASHFTQECRFLRCDNIESSTHKCFDATFCLHLLGRTVTLAWKNTVLIVREERAGKRSSSVVPTSGCVSTSCHVLLTLLA
jgi:hypothetical protein